MVAAAALFGFFKYSLTGKAIRACADNYLGAKVVGVNNNTDFYRAVREGEVSSVATPLHRGRSQQVWVVESHGAGGKLIARGQVRLQNLYDAS